MEIDLRNGYGSRINANVKVFALLAVVLLGILLAFNSENVNIKHARETSPVEFVTD